MQLQCCPVKQSFWGATITAMLVSEQQQAIWVGVGVGGAGCKSLAGKEVKLETICSQQQHLLMAPTSESGSRLSQTKQFLGTGCVQLSFWYKEIQKLCCSADIAVSKKSFLHDIRTNPSQLRHTLPPALQRFGCTFPHIQPSEGVETVPENNI